MKAWLCLGGGGGLLYLGLLGMCRWTGCLFELLALAPATAQKGVVFKTVWTVWCCLCKRMTRIRAHHEPLT